MAKFEPIILTKWRLFFTVPFKDRIKYQIDNEEFRTHFLSEASPAQIAEYASTVEERLLQLPDDFFTSIIDFIDQELKASGVTKEEVDEASKIYEQDKKERRDKLN